MPVWGRSPDGKEVVLTTLRSAVMEVDVSSFGCALVAVRIKAPQMPEEGPRSKQARMEGGRQWIDVVLGYESLEKYTTGGTPNFSSLVGRCGNRIAGGTFELDGVSFVLDKNDGPNHIHGGTEGLWQRTFDVMSTSETAVTLTCSEPDGHMGYPGKVDVTVTYEVRENELHFIYEGVTDKPTLLSLTNHGYWNLKGHAAGDVLDHKLMLAGSRRTAVDDQLIITGELLSVEGTGHDFRGEPRLLREAVEKEGPLDANYCLDRPEGAQESMAALLVGPNGLSMEVWTDAPGIQLFTGNILGQAGKGMWHGKGAEWEQHGAVCLEPQLWPDGIHHKHFRSPVLRPGETYKHHSWHVFKES